LHTYSSLQYHYILLKFLCASCSPSSHVHFSKCVFPVHL
jgi:hypothetical protein